MPKRAPNPADLDNRDLNLDQPGVTVVEDSVTGEITTFPSERPEDSDNGLSRLWDRSQKAWFKLDEAPTPDPDTGIVIEKDQVSVTGAVVPPRPESPKELSLKNDQLSRQERKQQEMSGPVPEMIPMSHDQLTGRASKLLDKNQAARLLTPGLSKANAKRDGILTVPLKKRQFFARFVFEDPTVANRIRDELGIRHADDINRQDVSIYAKIKSFEAPSFAIDTETFNVYNKNRTIVKDIKFGATQIALHDSVDQSTRQFWRIIYSYYFNNNNDFDVSNQRSNKIWNDSVTPGDHHTGDRNMQRFGYTLRDKKKKANLFSRIEFYSMHGGWAQQIDLHSPTITSMNHGTFSHSDMEIAELNMTFQCDNVVYAKELRSVTKAISDVFLAIEEDGLGSGVDPFGKDAFIAKRGLTTAEKIAADAEKLKEDSKKNAIKAALGIPEEQQDETIFGRVGSLIKKRVSESVADVKPKLNEYAENIVNQYSASTDTPLDDIPFGVLFGEDQALLDGVLAENVMTAGAETIGLPTGNITSNSGSIIDGFTDTVTNQFFDSIRSNF